MVKEILEKLVEGFEMEWLGSKLELTRQLWELV